MTEHYISNKNQRQHPNANTPPKTSDIWRIRQTRGSNMAPPPPRWPTLKKPYSLGSHCIVRRWCELAKKHNNFIHIHKCNEQRALARGHYTAMEYYIRKILIVHEFSFETFTFFRLLIIYCVLVSGFDVMWKSLLEVGSKIAIISKKYLYYIRTETLDRSEFLKFINMLNFLSELCKRTKSIFLRIRIVMFFFKKNLEDKFDTI